MFLDASYRGKGFEMWMRLIQSYAPTDSMSTFVHFMKVYKLKQGTSEDWHEYMARVRGIFAPLHGKSISDLSTLFAIVASDHTRYGGLIEKLEQGDPSVIDADLTKLEQLGESLDARNANQ